jgi:hypothetical protein
VPARLFDRHLVRMQQTLRGHNAILHAFELWVGLAGIIAGVVFFYSPASIDNNAISQVIGHILSATWEVGYLLAGMSIWYGLLRPSPRIEVVGLWLLGAATATQGIAIFSIFGLRGATTALMLLALTVAAWLRALVVQAMVMRLPSGVIEGDDF